GVDRLAHDADRFGALRLPGVFDVLVRPPAGAAGQRAFAERVQLVDELHHRGDGRSELLALFAVGRHAAGGLARLAAPRLRGGPARPAVVGPAGPAAAGRLAAGGRRPPRAREAREAPRAARVAPPGLLLGRRDEHDVQAGRGGAVLLEHRVGIDR